MPQGWNLGVLVGCSWGVLVVMLKCHHVASQPIQDFLEVFFMFYLYKIKYLVVSKKNNPLIVWGRKIHPSGSPFVITGQVSWFQMSDLPDGFFYPTLTLMIDSYNLVAACTFRKFSWDCVSSTLVSSVGLLSSSLVSTSNWIWPEAGQFPRFSTSTRQKPRYLWKMSMCHNCTKIPNCLLYDITNAATFWTFFFPYLSVWVCILAAQKNSLRMRWFFWLSTMRDFPTILKSGPGGGHVEFGKKAFGQSKLGKIDTGPPF